MGAVGSSTPFRPRGICMKVKIIRHHIHAVFRRLLPCSYFTLPETKDRLNAYEYMICIINLIDVLKPVFMNIYIFFQKIVF